MARSYRGFADIMKFLTRRRPARPAADGVNALDRSAAARTCTPDSAVGTMSDSTAGPVTAAPVPDQMEASEVCDGLGHGGRRDVDAERPGRGGQTAGPARSARYGTLNMAQHSAFTQPSPFQPPTSPTYRMPFAIVSGPRGGIG